MAASERPRASHPDQAATGIEGLDDILGGGFAPNRLYLIDGEPGAGKTTLSMQFLMSGVQRGESVLYITLSETEEELQDVAASHGWSLEGISICQLAPTERNLQPAEQYTMFYPSEVELGETVKSILEHVQRVKPSRVVIDSLSELRLLSGSALRYRREVLALKQYFAGRRCTVLLLDDLTTRDHDLLLHSIAHAVISLEEVHTEYGAERRHLRVTKFRGRKFRGGYHDYAIVRGGLEVFPRIVAAEHRQTQSGERLASGIIELDNLLGGGLERGTSTLIVGAPGTGKSTLATQFAIAAAERGQIAALFIFDESPHTLLTRAAGLGMNLAKHVEDGRVIIQQVDPAELSPGEFATSIRRAVERRNASVVVVDSLNGYLNAMPGERFLVIQLHELLTFLGQYNVATLLVGAHQGLIGPMNSPVDASYLADAVVLLRFFEARGEVHQAISVVKKRGGSHERTIREFHLDTNGIHIGEPLRQFRGVLTGVPVLEAGRENSNHE